MQLVWHTHADASVSGDGGYIVEIGPSVSHGHWPYEEREISSTWGELRAVHAVLLASATKL